MSEKFDPRPYLSSLKGKDYLEVKWRLLWLRTEHPDASIVTELLTSDLERGYALVRAHVRIPNGGEATGLGSETSHDFGDYLEKAETKAIGRALAALGFGTQFCGDEIEEGSRIVDSPVARPTRALPPPPSVDTASAAWNELAPATTLPVSAVIPRGYITCPGGCGTAVKQFKSSSKTDSAGNPKLYYREVNDDFHSCPTGWRP